MRISPEVWRGEAARMQAAADLTWKSQFCNRAFHPLRNISRSGCSYTRSTGHTWRAMHGREHLRGTDPEWASRSPRSAPSFRPGGDREPTFPNGHRASDWGHTNRCGATSWLLGEGGYSRANVPSWERVSTTTPRGKHSRRDCYALYLSASRNPLNQKYINIFVAESLLTKRLLQVFLLFWGSWSTCLCPLTSLTLFTSLCSSSREPLASVFRFDDVFSCTYAAVANHGQVAMATGLNIGTLRLPPKVYLRFGKTSIKADGSKANYFIDVLFFSPSFSFSTEFATWTLLLKSEKKVHVYLVRRLAFWPHYLDLDPGQHIWTGRRCSISL